MCLRKVILSPPAGGSNADGTIVPEMKLKKSNYRDFRSFRQRCLSREHNLIMVPRESLLSVALVFPNSYAVGMANLGFQTIYRLLNDQPGVRCERAFWYDEFPGVTRTLESGTELRQFDLVAFSVAYELDYPNLLQILIAAGIDPFSATRREQEPLILAGGAMAFMNPTPIAPFIDFFYLGEIEPQLHELVPLLLRAKNERYSRERILMELAQIRGIYVPTQPPATKASVVHRALSDKQPQYSPVVSPDSHFKNMFLVEAGRGCGRHCNFCAASHIYHPLRIYPPDQVLDTILRYCHSTRRIGLIGAALSDYPRLYELCKKLTNQRYELGLSSFRLDMITDEFLAILERGEVRSLTFAPEAGTESLRQKIHKNLSDKQILEAAHALAGSSIRQIKLYFMIGLPEETEDDIVGLVELVRELARIILVKGKDRSLTISVNTFIPKPFTPFQWQPMVREPEIRRIRKYLAQEFKKIPGVAFTKKSIKEESLQGIFSLGDETIARAIHYKLTHQVEWEQAWQKEAIDIEKILYDKKRLDDKLPWDFVEYPMSRQRLIRQLRVSVNI
ncbi:MAG: B12-binding domain-containing radical SAM protein [candidate division KSB1 bacterium]|nr:B12-binding domain-containing radical SAM protein [candidate division KSB1 bacterium]